MSTVIPTYLFIDILLCALIIVVIDMWQQAQIVSNIKCLIEQVILSTQQLDYHERISILDMANRTKRETGTVPDDKELKQRSK